MLISLSMTKFLYQSDRKETSIKGRKGEEKGKHIYENKIYVILFVQQKEYIFSSTYLSALKPYKMLTN